MGEPRFFEHPISPAGYYRFETPLMPAMPTNRENYEVMRLAIEWCVDQFGPHSLRWFYDTGQIFISDATDATAFKLRWVDGKVPTDG